MLPDVLFSTYIEYKKDTDAIAGWLASTAKLAGFSSDSISSVTAKQLPSSRLKGKARTEAKKNASISYSTRLPGGGPRYVISIQDFTTMAEYLLAKKVAVPRSFQSTLNRVISVRSGFGSKLSMHGDEISEEENAKHENFVEVLKRVRTILTPLMPEDDSLDLPSGIEGNTDGLANRFAGLQVYEPSQDFVDAPAIERPAMAKNDLATYEVDTTSSSVFDALFVFRTLLQDINRMRGIIEAIWVCVKVAEYDISAAAIATNTAIELVRGMVDEVAAIFEPHGGAYRMMKMTYFFSCLHYGISHTELVSKDPYDNFNYESYDVGNATFYTAHRMLNRFCLALPSLRPNYILLYDPAEFTAFDPKSDRSTKTGYEKYEDDRSLLFPFLTDLMTIAQSLGRWPVDDECLRAVKEMIDTQQVPFYAAFAMQVFLDINYILGDEIEMPYQKYLAQSKFMTTDVEAYLNFHPVRLHTWPESNDKSIKEFITNVQFVHKDPLYRAQRAILRNKGIKTMTYKPDRLLRTSPVMCGLVLYDFRVDYHMVGFTVADGWGSIMYSAHLYNAFQQAKLIDQRWLDMELVRAIVGDDSFYVGGEPPKTPLDQLKKISVQLGTSVASLLPSSSRRHQTSRQSRNGARGLKDNAAVFLMFKERYGGTGEEVLTAERVHRIIELSKIERGVDAQGRQCFTPIVDDKKLKENKKLRHGAANPSKYVNAIERKRKEGVRLPPEKLVWSLLSALQNERMEFAYPYLFMHRWCWRFLENVKEVCEPLLKQLFGREYLVRECELPSLVGYIFMAQYGTKNVYPDKEPLERAADALLAIFDAGFGEFVAREVVIGRLGIRVALQIAEQ